MWRKPFRTTLTFLSIAVAFVLFGLLHGVTTVLDQAMNQFAANRLMVQHAEGRFPLPIAYLSKIEQLDGVVGVAGISYLPGYFGEPRNWTYAVAWTDAEGLLASGEIKLSRDEATAFAHKPNGAIADRRLAQKYGWGIGDQLPLTSVLRQNNGSNVWTFELVGLYDAPPNSLLADQFWIRHHFFDAARLSKRGTVDTYIVYTIDPARNDDVANAIDSLFSNSSSPTSTTSGRELLRAGMEQAIDFNLLVKAILSGSFFTLLFVTATTMMQSVRERIPELAVLKALGYSSAVVLCLVFAEALVLYAFGAVFGLGVSEAFFPMIAPIHPGSGNRFAMPWHVILQGCLIATAAAGISAVVPARRAQTLTVVNALRRG
jgi:putative ABC transport system permease protein